MEKFIVLFILVGILAFFLFGAFAGLTVKIKMVSTVGVCLVVLVGVLIFYSSPRVLDNGVDLLEDGLRDIESKQKNVEVTIVESAMRYNLKLIQ